MCLWGCQEEELPGPTYQFIAEKRDTSDSSRMPVFKTAPKPAGLGMHVSTRGLKLTQTASGDGMR